MPLFWLMSIFMVFIILIILINMFFYNIFYVLVKDDHLNFVMIAYLW